MTKPTKLAAIFCDCAPCRDDVPKEPSELEELLESAVETGRRAWPHLALSAEDFVRHLARLLPPSTPQVSLAQVLVELHLCDLYLACACTHNVPEALVELEHRYLAKLRKCFRQPASVLDDIIQELRVDLLVGSKPKLRTYGGRASLASWIRVLAVHLLPSAGDPGAGGGENALLDAMESIPAPGPAGELELTQRLYGTMFRETLREVLARLTHDQRCLLRYYYADGLNTTVIGKLYGVNQSTAWRRIESVRTAVYEEVRRLLQERLRLSSQEFNSLLEVIRSQLDMSFSVLLRDEDDGGDKDDPHSPKKGEEEDNDKSKGDKKK